jgi:hypothetical protein
MYLAACKVRLWSSPRLHLCGRESMQTTRRRGICETFRNAHISNGTSSKHLTCTSRLDSVDYHATVARALVKLSSPLDKIDRVLRPRTLFDKGFSTFVIRSDLCTWPSIWVLADGIFHLRPRTAVLRGARWAWSLTCGVWWSDTLSVFQNVIRTSRFLVYRPSCVCVHLLSDRISARISLRASANRRLDARGAGWACGAARLNCLLA